MTAGSVVFLFILVAALGFFALNVQRLVSYLQLGHAEVRTELAELRAKVTQTRWLLVISILFTLFLGGLSVALLMRLG